MTGSHNVLKRAGKLQVSPELDAYSKVIIYTGEVDEEGNDIIYSAGEDGGEVLEVKNPFGTQQMADNILTQIKGWRYQPYEAVGAHLDPVAEMGDGVTINDVYSGIYVRATTFDKMMTCSLGAPTDTEVDHEFSVESASDRTYSRFVKSTKSMLRVTANQISAEVENRTQQGLALSSQIQVNAENIETKVAKQSGDSSSAFGWTLDSDSWTVWRNNTSTPILKATKDGLEVNGRIKSGYIGGDKGFIITATAIYNNIPSMSGTQSTGIYLGTDGIKLGNKFKVDSGGNLTATSGTFGSLSVSNGGTTVGSYGGSLSGCGGTVSGLGGSVSGIGGSLSTGISVGSKNIATYVGDIVANKVSANYIEAEIASLDTIRVDWERFAPGSIYYLNSNGAVTKARVLLTRD